MGICMAASKQTYTHTHVQCNSASVGLAQAYPNQYMGTLLVLKLPKIVSSCRADSAILSARNENTVILDTTV